MTSAAMAAVSAAVANASAVVIAAVTEPVDALPARSLTKPVTLDSAIGNAGMEAVMLASAASALVVSVPTAVAMSGE